MPAVEISRREVTRIPAGEVVLATGPLTSPALSQELGRLLGSEHLFFYDAIAPIVDRESLDMSKLFWASRYGKGGADYLNAPMDRDQYLNFYRQLIEAEVVPLADFEQRLFFEGCLPIEELARRGVDTPRFGPMKPVGLTAPDGSKPYAVVQMRQERSGQEPSQPGGLPSAHEVARSEARLAHHPGSRAGRVRPSGAGPPQHLYQRAAPSRSLLPAAQTSPRSAGGPDHRCRGLSGVGRHRPRRRFLHRARTFGRRQPEPLPSTTALGALARHLTESAANHFQPANINYGLFDRAGREAAAKGAAGGPTPNAPGASSSRGGPASRSDSRRSQTHTRQRPPSRPRSRREAVDR